MKKRTLIFTALTLAFTLLMSLPWLVPHLGWLALIGFLPLLIMERLATEYKVKHFWWWHYGAFVLWNAATTWWVGGATVGGAVFAILANALQMSVVFGAFRWVKRRTRGVLPYVFLAAAWIAWERYYLTVAQISWPWLVLGNAFADTTGLIQWYSVLGTLGGSLWVWVSNLSLLGLMVSLSDGRIARWNSKARVAALGGALLAVFGPMVWSAFEKPKASEPTLKVVIGQPNYDPYEKFQSLSREEQDKRYLALLEQADWSTHEPTLVLAPETFTSHVYTDHVLQHETFLRFQNFLKTHPQATFLYGASTIESVYAYSKPNDCAYDFGEVANGRHLWALLHNSAILTDTTGVYQLYHKSKLVVGTELTPYPKVFIPLENLLGGNLMAKDVGQPYITCLTASFPTPVGSLPIGTAICYESVYGEFCTGYVRKGAQLLAVITNDAWWGNTPGYRQHLNYSRLRAIETRRWVARCANTGISAFISPAGQIVDRTSWWEPALLEGRVGLSTEQTFFVRYGDMVGRVSVFLFLLLLAAAIFRGSTRKL
jgi:apolipoprotein N-acyltransferase